MRKVILLTGPARSGKDSVADILKHYYGFQSEALADPIRAMLAAGGLVTANDLKRKESPIAWIGKSPRQLMQTLGTDWGRRTVDMEIWVRLLVRKISASPADIVVTDVRFENEVALLVRAFQADVWHITRPGARPVAAHESEAGVDFKPHHVRILNDGTLDQLAERVRQQIAAIS